MIFWTASNTALPNNWNTNNNKSMLICVAYGGMYVPIAQQTTILLDQSCNCLEIYIDWRLRHPIAQFNIELNV